MTRNQKVPSSCNFVQDNVSLFSSLFSNILLSINSNNLCVHVARFDSVLEGRVKISDLCIACGEVDVCAEHPLFEGGLCKECKVRKK